MSQNWCLFLCVCVCVCVYVQVSRQWVHVILWDSGHATHQPDVWWTVGTLGWWQAGEAPGTLREVPDPWVEGSEQAETELFLTATTWSCSMSRRVGESQSHCARPGLPTRDHQWCVDHACHSLCWGIPKPPEAGCFCHHMSLADSWLRAGI